MRKDISLMSIGAIAKQSGVGIEAIRYYERIGLLKPVGRKASGYRIYNADSLKILRFLRHAQELGFSLSEIKALLALTPNTASSCKKVQVKAEKHLQRVEEKLERLSEIKSVLINLIGQCREKRTDSRCPILECFSDDKQLPSKEKNHAAG